MRRLLWTVLLIMVPSLLSAGQPAVLRIVERVQPACGAGADDSRALVIVQVLDVRADPMEGVTVDVTSKRSLAFQKLTKLTDSNGRAVFTLNTDAEVRLSAGHVGFATSVAERVTVKRGCMSAVVLPLQVVPPRDIIF